MEDSVGLCWEHFGGNKETQGMYHYAVPQVPTSLESPPSFHLSDILAWFVVLWPGFFSCKREDKEEWDYTILTEHQTLPCSVGYDSACHTVVNSKKKIFSLWMKKILSTDGNWCQFNTNRNPWSEVHWRRKLYSAQTAQQWNSLAVKMAQLCGCPEVLRPWDHPHLQLGSCAPQWLTQLLGGIIEEASSVFQL